VRPRGSVSIFLPVWRTCWQVHHHEPSRLPLGLFGSPPHSNRRNRYTKHNKFIFQLVSSDLHGEQNISLRKVASLVLQANS
jgi:hypothetical protein